MGARIAGADDIECNANSKPDGANNLVEVDRDNENERFMRAQPDHRDSLQVVQPVRPFRGAPQVFDGYVE